jgi:fused signal recognition particle receptor
VQRLSLLSGGEKALGAISFLFANIGRFVALLRRYSDRAQFVVIGHDGRRRRLADRLASPPARRSRSSQRRVKPATRLLKPSAIPSPTPATWLPDVAETARLSCAAVARSWAQLLGEADGVPEPEDRQAGMFSRLRDSLSKSRRALTEQIQAAAFDPGDDLAWERLEEALIQADVGVRATAELVQRLEARGELGDLGEALADEVAALFGDPGTLNVGGAPSVILVVGVNGTGKTTTIGKLAAKLAQHGHSVVVAAADTFRAAAEEQLEIWAQRAGADFVGSERGGDPAAVAYDAIDAAQARGRDVVIVDTAGRLHTQANLMEELAKVRRVIEGKLVGAPHETLLVVDATTGQNGLQQARLFGETVGVTGVALTKLDGSAKGGVAIPIAYELGLPVKLIGVGEQLDDLRPFDPQDFARALVSG